MQVVFFGSNDRVAQAVAAANKLLANDEFFERIRSHDAFSMATASPRQIADLMQGSAARVEVQLYKSRWPLSKALAYEDARYPNTVFLNSRRLDRSTASICATFIHECVHALDSSEPGLRFGHGDNNPNGKENTAPYWIGDLAYELISGAPPVYAQVFESMDTEWV